MERFLEWKPGGLAPTFVPSSDDDVRTYALALRTNGATHAAFTGDTPPPASDAG